MFGMIMFRHLQHLWCSDKDGPGLIWEEIELLCLSSSRRSGFSSCRDLQRQTSTFMLFTIFVCCDSKLTLATLALKTKNLSWVLKALDTFDLIKAAKRKVRGSPQSSEASSSRDHEFLCFCWDTFSLDSAVMHERHLTFCQPSTWPPTYRLPAKKGGSIHLIFSKFPNLSLWK